MTLTEFLQARITEDEADAHAAIAHERAIREIKPDWGVAYAWVMMLNPPGGKSGGSHNFQPGSPTPARVLAECEAKRRIAERHTNCDDTSFGEPCNDLRDLALPYADHPDYDEAWRV